MRKKLAIIVPSLAAGGSERVISILANHIDHTQFEVALVIIDGSTRFYAIDNPHVTIYDLKIKRLRQALLALPRLISTLEPDIVLSTLGYLNLFLGLTRFLFPRSIRFIARESSIVSINNQLYRWPRLWHFMTRSAYRNIDFCICQSAYMQADLCTHYGVAAAKTAVIFNPIDTTHAPILETIRPDRPLQFITVGRLNPEKGYLRLFEALRQAQQQGLPPFQYHILGEGPDRPQLEALIAAYGWQDTVVLHGLVTTPLAHLAQADYYLHGSYFEGFPNAVLEAGLCGLPVVAFDMPGGTNEILTDGFNGRIVADVATFATALTDLATHDTFDRVAIQAHIKTQFEAKNIIKQYESVLLTAL